jgi:CxxC-x17-CxxC domain-containing protein
MTSVCTGCGKGFEITPEDSVFLDLFQVPAPKQCPDCRMQRRLCERNTRCLYYRKCDLTGQQIVSQYRSDQPFPVYGIDAWISDRWDGLTYGRALDFTRPFFEQFKELLNVVPHLALFNTPGTMQNSEFNNCTGYLKNCYLICESDVCEDCYYSNLLKKSKDLVDCSVCYECERCYECIDCIGCHTLSFSQDCLQCSESFFLRNCHGCKDCIGCVNQRNKQYMIFNKQYTKDEYEGHKKAFALTTRSGLKKLAAQCAGYFVTQPLRATQIERSEGSSGDRIYDCKNAVHCFDVKDIEDCRHCERLSLTCKTCMDFNSWGQNSELVYQCSACGDRTYNSKFCSMCITVANCDYCFECAHSSDLFGCVGLKNKKFCIFNKQYTEQEYRALRAKLIDHMKSTGEYGEYFPMSLCAFAYNESFAPDLFPMTKEEVLAKGWEWYEDNDNMDKRYMGTHIDLPETSAEASEELCKQILLCTATNKPYKIIPQEFRFYQSMNLPLPALCPDERHRLRIAKRNPYKIWKRSCAKCGNETDTTYSPDRKEPILCEKCYLETVY